MDAPDGGNATTDDEMEEALRLLESHMRGMHKQFERIKRMMKIRQIRTVSMQEQQHKR